MKVRPRDAICNIISREAPRADFASRVSSFIWVVGLSTAAEGFADAIEREKSCGC